jgi:hypothetical protein
VTSWKAIEESFTRLRDFALADIEGFRSNRTGGNYGLVALVVVACDALGRRCYGGDSGHLVFRRCLPDEWKAVSDILYNALRHGLIHLYDPMIVMDAGEAVGFAVGWAGASRHMPLVSSDPKLLYVNATSLASDLRRAFDEIEQELRADAELRDIFYKRDRKSRELHLDGSDAERWRAALGNAPVSSDRWPPLEPSQGATGPRGVRGFGR